MYRTIATLTLLAFAFGITILALGSLPVLGSSNMTTIAKVRISNTKPNITSIIINPPSLDLVPGNTSKINCTAYVWDYDGWDDINITNATLYSYADSKDSDMDDNNYHYTNSTCSCSQVAGNAYNASCTCTFDIWYYASNGTWVCNFTAGDGNYSDTYNASGSINTVLGVGVPDQIDFGNLSVTETSALTAANITNWGNLPINISVRGFGGLNETAPGAGNSSMICSLNNVSTNTIRFSTSSLDSYPTMTNLSNATTSISSFNLPVRTNDTNYGNDTNSTYWSVKIPIHVGGTCNGTILFYGTETSI